MISKIKERLIEEPENIKTVLESFDYHNIVIHSSYISFGRDAQSSKKSIVIQLNNNPSIYVTDYPLNINKELFSYICDQRGVSFKTLISSVKNILGIDNIYDYFNNENKYIFGGFYKNIKKSKIQEIKTYDSSVLDKYERVPNRRFLNDNISLVAQKYFDIRYDTESNSIVIPILDPTGQLMGIKCRVNHEIEDGEQKYWYLLPCRMSYTLYGLAQNYEYLVDNTIYVLESEKSVQQCYSYGIRNCLALGSGSISPTQVKLLLSLNPKEIIFLHDYQYDIDSIMHNIDTVKNYLRFTSCKIGWWDWRNSVYPSKVSPSDLGKEVFNNIVKNEIRWEVNGEEIQCIS